jgi:cellulose synthase/poly-beta-1,6-N-acetylglucosamine synthase-like glycosyltransferase
MIFLLVSFAIILCYALLISAISVGWFKLNDFERSDQKHYVKISIIVAVRNEASAIGSLLESLLKQDYPPEHFEMIIVDDHSTDETKRRFEEITSELNGIPNLKFISLEPDDGFGKKAALSHGIKLSGGDLIVITDADCTAGSSWISTIAAFYDRLKPQMILGAVQMTDGGNFFGKLQSLEFMSLISSAAGSCSAGFPLLANGANIAFTRQAFESCGGFSGHMEFPSGDDMFLMMSIKKKFGAGSIRFLKSADAIVKTTAIKGIKPFLQQRMRWVSKSKGYTDPVLIATSILVYLANAILLISGISAILFPGFYKIFLLVYLAKMIIDFPLMLSFARFQKSGALLWLFPFMELLNAVYTVFIGIIGNIGKYEWKGRR